MKRNSVRRAYQNIRPDEEARDRMLNNILLSSEISPAGKDEPKMRKKMKPMVIAAIIVVMITLMGCAILALSLKEMKIGETSYHGEILDSEGNLLKGPEIMIDVISLHGFEGSPTYEAHQEWYQFREEYDSNHVITEEENTYVPPEAYEAYSVYNQELIDKVDEIVQKYGLKLLGTFAPFQRHEREVFYEATGIESLLNAESAAIVEKESGYFYEGGNFKVEFNMTMNGEDGQWPYRMLNSVYYSKSDYFDVVHFVISDPEDWKQWNYIASDGTEVLIAHAESGYGAMIFSILEDAIIRIGIDGYYQNDDGETTFMTDKQLEQIADQFDYSIKVETVDMEYAKENLERFRGPLVPVEDDPKTWWKNHTDYDSLVQAYIDRKGEEADELYFHSIDVDDDGLSELVLGTEDQIDTLWTIIDGRVNLIINYGEKYKLLEEAWSRMEKKPLAEYFEESAVQADDAYERYMLDAIAKSKHPENIYYALKDVDGNGVVDLLYGSSEMLDYVWTVEYSKNGYPNIKLLSFSFTEDEWNTLNAAWPGMEKKPITEYFAD